MNKNIFKIINWIVTALAAILWIMNIINSSPYGISIPFLIGAFFGVFIVPGILWLIYYLVYRKKTDSPKTDHTEKAPVDISKQKSTIEELVKAGVYNEEEAKNKIAEIESKQNELKIKTEREQSYQKALESLKYLLKTSVITETEYRDKLDRLNFEYQKGSFHREINQQKSINLPSESKTNNSSQEVKREEKPEDQPIVIGGLSLPIWTLIFILIMLIVTFIINNWKSDTTQKNTETEATPAVTYDNSNKVIEEGLSPLEEEERRRFKQDSMIAFEYEEQKKVQNSNSEIKSVKIGDQIWMAENLNVDKFRNGDPIPEVRFNDNWEKAGDNGFSAWCYYNHNSSNGLKYGKLYNWFAVMDKRGLAPKGWHIPSETEWIKLINYLGGEKNAAKEMKSKMFWEENGNGTNESGFSGFPGGIRDGYGKFKSIGYVGHWWSSTEVDSDYARSFSIEWYDNIVGKVSNHKSVGFSVRCIKD